MKNIIKLLVGSLLIVFTLQGTVFAAELSLSEINPSKDAKAHCADCNKHTKHYTHAASRILTNKYGVKLEDIENAKASGKTFFDIARSKGMNESEFKAAIIAPKLKALDEAVNTGELDKNKAEEIKTKTKDNIANWNGKIEDLKKHKEDNKDSNKTDNIKEQD